MLADDGQILGRVISQAFLQRGGWAIQRMFHQTVHFLGPHPHAGDRIGLPTAHMGDGLAFPQEHRRFPQRRFGSLLFGDVVPNGRKIGPVPDRDDPIRGAYETDCAILATMGNFDDTAASLDKTPQLLGYFLRRPDSLNAIEREPGELLARVAESATSRLVEFGEVQRLGIDQHDTICRLIDDGAVDFFPFPQSIPRSFLLGDVAPHREDPLPSSKIDQAQVE